MKILSVGEILWDVVGDAEHLGGAPFNLAAHARRLGEDVIFMSAVGADARGQRALARMLELGLPASYVSTVNTSPTGWVSVRIDAGGQPVFTIHRPAAYDDLILSSGQIFSITKWRPDWICFGTLHQMSENARNALDALLFANPGTRRFYDVNLRVNSYTPELLRRLLACADTVKINENEAETIASMLQMTNASSPWSWEDFCKRFAREHALRVVCVTLGARGCAVLIDNVYCEDAGYPTQVVDTIGAGDAFSAALLHGLSRAWPTAKIADFANRIGALIASRAGAVPPWTMQEVLAMSRVAMGGDDRASGF